MSNTTAAGRRQLVFTFWLFAGNYIEMMIFVKIRPNGGIQSNLVTLAAA
jgi:hypothetical protein